MIEPYETVLTKTLSNNFSSLGLLPTRNSNFTIELSDGIQALAFSTEPRYQPALSITIINAKSVRFELGIVKKILTPVLFEKDLNTLKSMKQQYLALLTDGKWGDAERQLTAYATCAVSQAAAFLADYWVQIFAAHPSYLAQYQSEEKAILLRFGIEE